MVRPLFVASILASASLLAGCPSSADAPAPSESSATPSEGAASGDTVAEAAADEPTSQPTGEPTSQPTGDPPQPADTNADTPGAASLVPPPEWILARVTEAESRLRASEPGQLLLRSIETHGGLGSWFEQGPLHFRFDYQPLGDGARRDTRQIIDTWSARAWHQLSADESATFGWTGDQAWSTFDPEGASVRPRFWALTPYYFVAMPFVAADPGVVLSLDGEGEVDGVPADLVRVGYEAGVGDAPDDYYVLYLAKDNGRLLGLRYIVSYPGFFEEGQHSPEKFMRFDDATRVNGMLLPGSLPTFRYDMATGEVGDQVTGITVSEIRFAPDTPVDRFEMPEGATVIDGL